jgi:hypothetical protein
LSALEASDQIVTVEAFSSYQSLKSPAKNVSISL